MCFESCLLIYLGSLYCHYIFKCFSFDTLSLPVHKQLILGIQGFNLQKIPEPTALIGQVLIEWLLASCYSTVQPQL